MIKFICIKETNLVTLCSKLTGEIIDRFFIGDIINVNGDSLYYINNEDNYIGSLRYYNEPYFKESFIPLAECRRQQIESIFDE